MAIIASVFRRLIGLKLPGRHLFTANWTGELQGALDMV
jgi:hypothetical protein